MELVRGVASGANKRVDLKTPTKRIALKHQNDRRGSGDDLVDDIFGGRKKAVEVESQVLISPL